MREEAFIEPKLLIWARESSGMAVAMAASKIKVPETRLREYETGQMRPTIRQLELLANVYKRPLAAFFLPEPPASEPEGALPDFRRPSAKNKGRTPELTFQIRHARFRREIALQLYEELQEAVPPSLDLKVQLTDEPKDVAIKIRTLFEITPAMQFAWKDEYEALRAWRTALEDNFVLVFQARRVAVDEVRGFSLATFPLPVIAVNSADAVTARIFSLMHEFCHLLLRQEGMCDLKESLHFSDGTKVEAFCNAVAACVLVPEELMKIDLKNYSLTDIEDTTKSLARKYWVSQYVVLRRMFSLKLISSAVYSKFAAIFENRKPAKKSGGAVPQHTLALSSCGRLFPRIVMESYASDLITGADVAEYLSLKTKYFDQVKEALVRPSGDFSDEI